MINLTDFLIIYLACGAPFGVYYFLKHRAEKLLWLKSFFNFVFWMPFALTLLRRRVIFRKPLFGVEQTSSINAERENVNSISKRIERILLASGLKVSIYEYRETVERYVGLTLAEKSGAATISEHEKEIFRVAPVKNVELGAICLHRRNRKRLSFHQTEARADFLFFIARLLKFAESSEVEYLSIELTEIIEDYAAQSKLEKMFAASQTGERRSVVNLENDLWKPPTHRPQPAQPISHLQTLKATASLRSED